MLSNPTRIAVAAAILVGTPLITATINDGALASYHPTPEVGIVIETPTSNQAHVTGSGPVTLRLVRPAKWHKLVQDNGGSLPSPGSQGHLIIVYLQRKEGGTWKHIYQINKPFYGDFAGQKLEENLWSKSSSSTKPMKSVSGLQKYRVRAGSYYKLTNIYDWTKLTNWREFSVTATAVPEIMGAVPKATIIGPKPPKIGRMPALQRKPGPPGPDPGPLSAPVLKQASPTLKIAPAKPGTVDSPTIDVPTRKLLVPRQ